MYVPDGVHTLGVSEDLLGLASEYARRLPLRRGRSVAGSRLQPAEDGCLPVHGLMRSWR